MSRVNEIDHLSNPFRYWVTSSNTYEFTYEGGTTLYHFCSQSLNIPEESHIMRVNVVFFANDPVHAIEVLIAAFEFKIKCAAQYMQYQEKSKGQHWEDFIRRAEHANAIAFKYITLLKEGKGFVTKAPNNQFYKVGWAENDTLLT